MLYSQPDFTDAESLVEETCCEHDYGVIFLLKFHCKLNPIEQCWGYAKEKYWKLPPSMSEDDLEQNVLTVLSDIPLNVIRRYILLYFRCFHTSNLLFSGSATKHYSLQMLITKVWMANKLHGWPKSIEGIALFQRPYLRSLMLYTKVNKE
jgi:hypothetical protein